MNDGKRGIVFFVVLISLAVFLLVCLGIYHLVDSHGENDTRNIDKNVQLSYIIDNNLSAKTDVLLSKEEQEELYDLAKNIKLGNSETKCEVDSKYFIKYDENELYLDENCGLAIYNDKTYSVLEGGDEISKFLQNKVDSLNNVYLYDIDQEKWVATEIKLSDEDKNEIRRVWANHSKETMIMNLAIFLKYYLYIDGDYIGIDEIDSYVSYNSGAGHIMILNQEMQDILSKYIKGENTECCSCCPNLKPGESCIDMCCSCSSISSFTMNDYADRIEMFGPTFNMYKGTEINSRDDAISNAKELWKKHLEFEESEKIPLNYEVSYDEAEDCYLVMALPKEERILGGGASIIMKKSGEVIALWGEN